MWVKLVSYITVLGLSMLKIVLGPITSKLLGLSFAESVLLSATGMMLTIFLFTSLLGKIVRRWFIETFFKNKKVFTPGTRRMVYVWQKYGLPGTAILTPILFSPLGGGIIVNTFGGKRSKIYLLMAFSALFWSTVYTYLVYLLNIKF